MNRPMADCVNFSVLRYKRLMTSILVFCSEVTKRVTGLMERTCFDFELLQSNSAER